ncbi:MAG: hypothetical protein AMS22_11110 [Thiotrichales bacterium SG8_50]|nr:MAG: hypothetical protein AMS22_11110 [Thiotrichales bacterium SG8_50]
MVNGSIPEKRLLPEVLKRLRPLDFVRPKYDEKGCPAGNVDYQITPDDVVEADRIDGRTMLVLRDATVLIFSNGVPAHYACVEAYKKGQLPIGRQVILGR